MISSPTCWAMYDRWGGFSLTQSDDDDDDNSDPAINAEQRAQPVILRNGSTRGLDENELIKVLLRLRIWEMTLDRDQHNYVVTTKGRATCLILGSNCSRSPPVYIVGPTQVPAYDEEVGIRHSRQAVQL
jgi:hypothetical protein